MIIRNTSVLETSTVLITVSSTNADPVENAVCMAHPFYVGENSFRFTLGSLNGTTDIPSGGTANFNFLIF